MGYGAHRRHKHKKGEKHKMQKVGAIVFLEKSSLDKFNPSCIILCFLE